MVKSSALISIQYVGNSIDSFYAFKLEINSKKLKDFQPDVRSDGFGSFLSFLSPECDNFNENYGNNEFHNSIKEAFFQLHKSKELYSLE